MRELVVAHRQVTDEEGQARVFHYAVQIGEMELSGGFSCESYGPKVWEDGGEVQPIPNVTVSLTRIDELMELLVRNRVSPCSLGDVVADWL